MTLLWPLLGNAALIVLFGVFGLGAWANRHARYLPKRVPAELHQVEEIMAMLYRLDLKWQDELAAYQLELEAWRRGELMDPTGAFPVVTEVINGQKRSDTRVEISAPTRTEQEAPKPPRSGPGRRRASAGRKSGVGE